MEFYKVHALGNDFIVVEKDWIREEPRTLSKAICHRHFGAGADGLIIIEKRGDSFGFRIFNADGSEAEISGNGIKCASAYLYYRGLTREKEIKFNSLVGERSVWLKERNGSKFIFRVSMGKPKLSSDSIPFDDGTYREKIIDYPLSIGNRIYPITLVSVGNPHAVLFFDNFPSSLEWKEIGSEIEEHPFFPERTNVEFVKIIDNSSIEVLFWERGVGETYSSGSGSCASAYAAYLKGLVGNRVLVRTPAGNIIVEVNEEIVTEGPVEVIYRGEWLK